jgi:hypothetical protein
VKTRSLLLASAALALALGATAANAATISFSFSNPLQLAEINQSGTLGFFDSDLGTLTSVSLTVSAAMSSSLTVTNTSAQDQTSRTTLSTDLLFGSNFGLLNPIIALANPLVSLFASTGFITLAAGASALFDPLTDTDSLTLTSSGALAGISNSFAVAGGDAFQISCESITGTTIQGGGGTIRTAPSTQARCGAEITYTYTPVDGDPNTPVPAPASLGLLGAALAGLSIARRKATRG